MPTAKKTTKKTTAKKAPVKATTAKRSVRSTKSHKAIKSHAARMQSFRLYRSQEPFFTFRISHQTVYWLVLCGSVLLLAMWVLDINQKVQHIYDQIDETNVIINSMPDPIAKKSQ